MRIVDRKAFLSLPSGTVYAKAETPPAYDFGPIEIKGETVAGVDFYSQRLIGNFEGTSDSDDWFDAYDAMVAGEARKPNFEIEGRDALFDDGQLFAVFDDEDVQRLIKRLSEVLAESAGN